ncbi:hypothetical protein LXA43DRAFT_58029 [Ganoderma leucocontextum]|nr:hypothetical protein LXA43DRAFT_58029 [Ganoderma leucocontextum]
MDPNPIRAARDQSVRRKAQLKAPTYNALSPLADGTGPNAALYHPAFARMWHAYTSEENLSHVELDADMNRVVAALRYELARPRFNDDKRYLDVLKKYFAKVFPGTTFHKKYRVLRNGKLDTVLDFAVTSPTPYGVEVVIVAGMATFWGSCSLKQALYGYRCVSSAENNLSIFMSSICPCLIILAAGPMLQINAVYLTDYVYLTPMAHLLLQLVPGTTDAYDTKLARQLQVVRNTVQMLAQSYAENHTGAHRGPGYLFPAPCVTPETGAAWTPGGGFEGFSLNFKDDYFTTEFRAVFRGEIIIRASPPPPPHQHAAPAPASPSRVPVYIKFAPQNGEEVHNFLYKHGFAPQLRWCGRVCGGPIMVVMDEMKGSTIQA